MILRREFKTQCDEVQCTAQATEELVCHDRGRLGQWCGLHIEPAFMHAEATTLRNHPTSSFEPLG